MRSAMRPTTHLAIWLAAATALALVTLAYFDPHLMVDLANRVWSCF
jgi:hypothetical protein